MVFDAANIDDARLDDALAYCLSGEARALARACAARAGGHVAEIGAHLHRALTHPQVVEPRYRQRLARTPEFVDWATPVAPPSLEPPPRRPGPSARRRLVRMLRRLVRRAVRSGSGA